MTTREDKRVARVFLVAMVGVLALIALCLQVPAHARGEWLARLHLPRTTELQHGVLTAAALALALGLGWAALRRPGQPLPSRLWPYLVAVAVLCAMASGLSRWQRNVDFDLGDNFHYYLGAKYAPELRYDKHYECFGTAQRRQKLELPKRYRDLRTNKIEKLPRALDKGAERACRRAFTTDRWNEFMSDVRQFHEWQPRADLHRRFTDHGYNGTPTWGAVAGTLTNAWPVSASYQAALGLLNFVLLSGAFTLVIAAFGWELALCYVVLFWVNYADRYLLGGALLRYLPISLLLSGAALCKLARPRLAGVCFGVAAALLIFPALWLVAAGAYAAWQLLIVRGRFRELSAQGRLALEMVVSGALAFIVCCVVGALYHGTFGIFSSFLDKMDLNSGRYASGRIGFVFNFMWPKPPTLEPEGYGPQLALLRESLLGISLDDVRVLLGYLLVAALAWAYRRAEVLTFMLIVGFALFFVGFPTVRYYYMGWVALPLALHQAPSSLASRAILAWLCVLSAACFIATPHVSHSFLHNTMLTMGITAVLLALAVPRVAASLGARRATMG